MGLYEIRNGKIIETRMIIDSEGVENMTAEECRAYIEQLEKEIRVLRKAGK
jgi:hypothetical protein